MSGKAAALQEGLQGGEGDGRAVGGATRKTVAEVRFWESATCPWKGVCVVHGHDPRPRGLLHKNKNRISVV
jgi:hypothetical protein